MRRFVESTSEARKRDEVLLTPRARGLVNYAKPMVGYLANLTLLDEELHVAGTFVEGRLAYWADDRPQPSQARD